MDTNSQSPNLTPSDPLSSTPDTATSSPNLTPSPDFSATSTSTVSATPSDPSSPNPAAAATPDLSSPAAPATDLSSPTPTDATSTPDAGPAVGVAPTALTGAAPIAAATPSIDPVAPTADASAPSVTLPEPPAPAGSTADTVPPISNLATSVAASDPASLTGTDATSTPDPLGAATTPANPLTDTTDPLSTTSTSSPNITADASTTTSTADTTSSTASSAADATKTDATDTATASTPPNPLALDSTPTPAGGALDTSGPLVGDQPILGQAPAAKPSPILNSAPTPTKKFDPKYMVPLIALGVTTVGLGVFLAIELLILRPNAESAAREAGRNSATQTQIKEVYNTRETEVTAEQDPLIPFSSNNSLDGNGTYLLSASGPKGLSALTNTSASALEFTVNWSDITSTYSDIKSATGTAKYTATGLDQKITEILYGTVGKKNYYFVILDNGTVAYFDVEESLNAKAFSATVLEDVTDVAKLLTSTTSSGNSATVLAQKVTGEYYDLSTYLQ